MKQTLTLLFSLLVCSQYLSAAELELKLELPNAEWLLPPVSPPQLQKEGLALPSEQDLINELMAFIGQQDFAAAIAAMKAKHGGLIELLETGDPQGQLLKRVVAGGFMQAPGSSVSATVMYLLGHIYFSLDEYAAAETAFLSALGPLPDYLRVHESLGLLYMQTKRYDEARTHLAQAAALGLNTANLYGALGFLNQKTENYWGASSAYQQAMMLDPDNRNWQQGLLYSLSQTYQYQSALTLVEQLLQKYPDESSLWLFRSQMSIQAEKKPQALSSLETAIRLGEDGVANLQVCATLHMELGSRARAVDLLKAGFGKGMDFVFIEQALDWLVQQDEWDYLGELLATLRTYYSQMNAQQQSSVLTREAGINVHNNQTAAARTALQEALTLDPANTNALMALGDIYSDARNYNQAELLFQRASAYPRFRENAFVSLAQLAIDQDNYQRALQLLRQVVADNPTRSDLNRNIDSLENLVLLQE